MQLTISQLLALVRSRLGGPSGNLAHNTALRKLTQLEQQLGMNGQMGWAIELPVTQKKQLVEPSQDFGKPSLGQSGPKEELNDAGAAPTSPAKTPARSAQSKNK